MEENEIIKQLTAENAQLRDQICGLNKNLASLQQQNIILGQRNGEMLIKMDSVLKTLDSLQIPSTSTGEFTPPSMLNSISNKRRADVGDSFRRAKNARSVKFAGDSDGVNIGNSSSELKLDDNVEMNEDATNVERNLKKDNNIGENNATGIDSWANITANADKRATKPTPIQIGVFKDNDFVELLKMIRDNFGCSDFEWIHLRKTATPRIVCVSNEVKDKMMEFLRSAGCEFNTYTDKDAKRSAFIVRGLQYDRDDDNEGAIRDTLMEFGVDMPAQISCFCTPSMKRQDNPNLLYQIVFNANANIDSLSQVKNIDGFRVKIEKMIGSKKIQCRRCQRLSHVASSCSFKYRCVQCVNTHGPGQCPRLTNKNLPFGCMNCHAAKLKYNDHTANDLVHCGFYKKNHANDGKANNNNNESSSVAAEQSKNTSRSGGYRLPFESNSRRTTISTDGEFGLPSGNAANGSTISKRQQKKLVNKFRQTGESNRVTDVTGNDIELNLNEKEKLFELF